MQGCAARVFAPHGLMQLQQKALDSGRHGGGGGGGTARPLNSGRLTRVHHGMRKPGEEAPKEPKARGWGCDWLQEGKEERDFG